ncbi:unnamed protein product [Rotaria sp. Silwood2]|nr:unnamed protein product [Rotaria sp. Silwood2]
MLLECDSGLLCIDWRDVCDGIQQCMSGFDEENCDILEFNECEQDEYRCMNGMCIPDEYFLDGDFDCLDWSDEIQYYDDLNCGFEEASSQCDDRICPPNRWSSGDVQCIADRFNFQNNSKTNVEYWSRRDQYFICETHSTISMWTLSNGRCYSADAYEELTIANRTIDEECDYLVKCALSQGAERNCSCGHRHSCVDDISRTCPSGFIQYPRGEIMGPYIMHVYIDGREWNKFEPDYVLLNGKIRCRGVLYDFDYMRLYTPGWNLREIEFVVCRSIIDNAIAQNNSYHQSCNHPSQTFNNRSYDFIDICNVSMECISAYRIHDGVENCFDKTDEINYMLINQTCSNLQHHRFRCSDVEPSCLSVNTLGNQQDNCKNKFDELWMGTGRKLSYMNCNSQSNHECGVLRQYIEQSWSSNEKSESVKKSLLPFRTFCNTFWDLNSTEDENTTECRKWWVCREDEWQCGTRQCIDESWVLDGEWDCADASDEDGIYTLDQSIFERNLKIIELSVLQRGLKNHYNSRPFSTICDLTSEYLCIRQSTTNLTHERHCICLHQIGDGHIDERNTRLHCDQSSML